MARTEKRPTKPRTALSPQGAVAADQAGTPVMATEHQEADLHSKISMAASCGAELVVRVLASMARMGIPSVQLLGQGAVAAVAMALI